MLRAIDSTLRAGAMGWRRELGLFAVAYLAYQVARVVIRGDAADALHNARQIFSVEQRTGLAVERFVQGGLLDTPWMSVLNWAYLGAQTVILVAGLVFVYRRDLGVYRVVRTTLLATWVVALPVYVVFPTAPPRLAGLGMIDAVSTDTPIALAADSTTLLFNPYAAVPSLHAGFALALGIAVAMSTRRRLIQIAGLAWGPLIALAVLATGNHFVFDIAAGLVATGIGFGYARWRGRGASAAQSSSARDPVPRPAAIHDIW